MEISEFEAIEVAKVEAAKALDTMIAKAGKANGIVSKSNFIVTENEEGGQVQLHGNALAKVGTGYGAIGDTIVEKIWNLVDQIAEALGLGKAASTPGMGAGEQLTSIAKELGASEPVELTDEFVQNAADKMVANYKEEKDHELDDNLEEITGDEEVEPVATKPKPAGRPKGSKNAPKAKK